MRLTIVPLTLLSTFSAAGVYTAAILEYVSAEVLELAGEAAHANGRRRITPRHLKLAIGGDGELNELLSGVIIPSGGVCPNIQPELLPMASKDK